MCSLMFDLVPSDFNDKNGKPLHNGNKMEKNMDNSQDGNEGGCQRHMWCAHRAFPLVSEVVQGAIPQHLVLFGPVVI